MAVPIRLGILVPSTNTTVEADFVRVVPKGATVHSHRLWMSFDIGEEALDRMNSEMEAGARHLAQAKVRVVSMVGTSNSFYRGLDWSLEMERIMSAAADGVPAVSTSISAVRALRFFGAKSISVATPYPDWNNERLRDYLEASGFRVLNVAGEPWAAQAGAHGINDQEPEVILDFAARTCDPKADALFCSCTAWRSMEVADRLEQKLGKPVVTSVQATMWRVFRAAGLDAPVKGEGRLLELMPESAEG